MGNGVDRGYGGGNREGWCEESSIVCVRKNGLIRGGLWMGGFTHTPPPPPHTVGGAQVKK